LFGLYCLDHRINISDCGYGCIVVGESLLQCTYSIDDAVLRLRFANVVGDFTNNVMCLSIITSRKERLGN